MTQAHYTSLAKKNPCQSTKILFSVAYKTFFLYWAGNRKTKIRHFIE